MKHFSLRKQERLPDTIKLLNMHLKARGTHLVRVVRYE